MKRQGKECCIVKDSGQKGLDLHEVILDVVKSLNATQQRVFEIYLLLGIII